MYRMTGLNPRDFSHLVGLDEVKLREFGATRTVAVEEDGYPCRVSLMDARVGDPLLLLNFTHLHTHSPYASRTAIYINERATYAGEFVDTVPPMLQRRLLSVRAYDGADMMIDADVVDGKIAEETIARFLSNQGVRFLQIHFAKRGCFAARVDRG
jgi:Protein of unknown function (DUF1203)